MVEATENNNKCNSCCELDCMIKEHQKQAKSKAQIKREIKEAKQQEARCLFCGSELGWRINRLDEIRTQEKVKQAFLICMDCLTGGELPDNRDLKIIREGWDTGGILLTNYKKYPKAEPLLLNMIEAALKLGNLRVYWAGKKVYMEARDGGITIELNVYRDTKEEDGTTY